MLNWLARWALLLVCVVMAIGSLHYVMGDPNGFAEPFAAKYQRHLWLVRVHGLATAVTLVLGPLGFFERLGYHRWRGRVYMLAVLVGALTAFPMALMAEGGLSSRLGFFVMATLWVYTGAMAWRSAVRRDYGEHRAWVIRNMALTLGAVTLRIYLYVFQHLDFDFDTLYPTAVWVAWLPTMAVAELLIPKSQA